MKSDVVVQVLESELADARQRRGGQPPRVLDVGGGSGVWAVPLASAGGMVTVVDPSPNALATLQRRAKDAGVADRVTPMQGDTDALSVLSPEGGADLVLAHGLLEVVDDVDAAMAALTGSAAVGGVVSVLVANRFAAVLARALAGRVDEALQLMRDADGRLSDAADPLQRRFDSGQLADILAKSGLSVELVQGQGVLADLVPGSAVDNNPRRSAALAELERAAARQAPLRDIATRLHALGRKTS